MYKTVLINDLEPVKQKYEQSKIPKDVKQFWSNLLNGYTYDKTQLQYKLQYIKSNGVPNQDSSNPFLQAFMNAYNSHEDIILSPDDIWTVIILNFTKYVNDNAEKLRKVFVDHEGKKKLTITEPIGKDENDWTDFFDQMTDKIKANVNGSIVSTIVSDFSTTGQVESLVNYACIMDTFKQYFSYGLCIPCCGIRNVKFMGTLEDWQNLRKKTENLAVFLDPTFKFESTTTKTSFFSDWMLFWKSKKQGPSNNLTSSEVIEKKSISNQFTKYIENLLPVLDKFTDTYNNKVDKDFWNKIMNLEHGRLGSGSCTYISGWILNFFLDFAGTKQDQGDIELNTVKIPVEVQNHNTGKQKICNVVAGFCGVEYIDNTNRPIMSIAVFEDTKSVKPL
jgi:hypothetical protein